jgi:uncharacterized membrane protein (DUF2068 family)
VKTPTAIIIIGIVQGLLGLLFISNALLLSVTRPGSILLSLGFGLILLCLALGLWTRKRWAYWCGLCLQAYYAVAAILALARHPSLGWLIMSLVTVLAAGYLLRSQTKAVFSA